MDCSTPGFSVHHQLPALAQTHTHWAGDAIQPSHPPSSPSFISKFWILYYHDFFFLLSLSGRFEPMFLLLHSSVQLSLVAQSCPTLCNPMSRNTPGLPVYHQLLEFTKPMSIKSVMPSNHLILCCLLLLPPSIFPNIRVFSNESALCLRWPKFLRNLYTFSHKGHTN